MEFENILKLIDSVSASGLTSFTLEDGKTKLVLEVNRSLQPAQTVQVTQMAAQSAGEPVVVSQSVEIEEPTVTKEPEGSVVTSPLVGVFYRASSPDAEPFVQVGDVVKKGQVVGIIESMKLMNEIESEVEGTVAEICLEDGQTAEYGQPIIRIV
jgi:acetyl-CoA carboxylase biotin carboxyl carrier protein